VTTAFAAGCGGGSESPAELCPAPAQGATVETKDFEFAPICLEAGEGTTITVDNTGDAPHTFTIREVDVDVDVDAGESDTVDLSGVAASTYKVTCTYHPQMVGALRVV
jgi:plastocyanin